MLDQIAGSSLVHRMDARRRWRGLRGRRLRSEELGQRHFITADPNGVLIDVIKPIPPSAEFLAHYTEAPEA